MTPLEWAAVITAISTAILTAIGLFGAAIKYIVSLILDAYKRQAEATIEAKNRDLAAKDQTIAKQDQSIVAKDAEIARLRHGVAETLGEVQRDVRALRQGLGHMIRRLLCRIADWLADTEWLRGMRATELEAERSAWRHERALRVDGIGDRVRMPDGRD